MGIGLGDVTTVFAILAALGIVFPGLLLAWSLLLPGTVERARTRVSRTPGRSFIVGLIVLLLASLPIAALNALGGPFQFFAYVLAFLALALISVGAAGIASVMGEHLRGQGVQATTPGALLRAAIALEFAMVFPIIGWFIVLPLTGILSLGASVFALLQWQPSARGDQPTVQPTAAPTLSTAQS